MRQSLLTATRFVFLATSISWIVLAAPTQGAVRLPDPREPAPLAATAQRQLDQMWRQAPIETRNAIWSYPLNTPHA